MYVMAELAGLIDLLEQNASSVNASAMIYVFITECIQKIHYIWCQSLKTEVSLCLPMTDSLFTVTLACSSGGHPSLVLVTFTDHDTIKKVFFLLYEMDNSS